MRIIEKMDSNEYFQSSWTLAVAIINDIANYQHKGREAFLVNGDLEKYYWNFEALARVIYGMLDEEERDRVKKKEKAILSYFPLTKENKASVSALLKDYDATIMDIIHKHKLDVPPKKDSTMMGG